MAQHSRRAAAAAAALALLLTACEGDGGGDGEVSVVKFRAGECFDSDGERSRTELEDVDTVPCREPHDNEVYAVFDHPAGEDAPFPGEDELMRFAQAECLERFAAFVGVAYEASDLSIGTIGPLEDSWDEAGDRQIACVLNDPDGKPLIGSRKASG